MFLIQHILRSRSKEAFKKDSLKQGVIEKCSAYAAREHGDVRRAIDLLRVAGEIAERQNQDVVEIKHLDEAEDKIERDRIQDTVTTQPKQHQVCLYSIIIARNLVLFKLSLEKIYRGLRTFFVGGGR